MYCSSLLNLARPRGVIVCARSTKLALECSAFKEEREIREFGRQPVQGDLVFQAQGEGHDGHEVAMDEILDEAEDGDDEEDTAMVPVEGQLPAVRILGAGDLDGVKLTDVVLPLPGFDVVYPPYLKAIYEELSQSLLGLSLADFSECTMVRLSGPKDLEYHAVPPDKLESWDQVLVDTDIARLLAQRLVPARETGLQGAQGKPEAPSFASTKPSNPEHLEHGAVVFSCVLPPSAYLTMMLRELMKESTGR
eukprot:symbB.v1.2.039503.t1/scaffold6611.1/size16714/2